MRTLRAGAAVILAAALIVGVVAVTTGAKPEHARTAAVDCATTMVQTDKGPVCGFTSGSVEEWLGIPFAAPPVGPLRWQPPQPAAAWSAPLSADTQHSSCPQPDVG